MALEQCRVRERWNKPAGAPGKPGPPNTSPLPKGTAGASKQALQQVVPASVLSAQLRPAFVELLLNAASSDYLNLRHRAAIERLQWLASHLEPLTSDKAHAPAIPGLPEFKATPQDARQFAVLEARVNSLLRQLTLGLDFHGQVANHVSLLSEKFYLENLDHLMELARNIESTWVEYSKSKDKKDQASASTLRAKNEYLKLVEVKKGERTRGIGQIEGMLGALNALDERRNEVWTQLHAAEADFKLAVASKAQGCDFGRVVAIAAACATLVATGGTSIAAWGSAAALFTDQKGAADNALPALAGEPGPVTPGGETTVPEGAAGAEAPESPPKPVTPGYVVTTLSKVVTTTAEFMETSQKFADLLEGEPGAALPTVPSDEMKILTTAEALKAQLEPFLGAFPEAVEYRNRIQEFVDVCTARNNRVLEYNNHLAMLRTLEVGIQQAELEAGLLQDSIARNHDPYLTEVAAMMEHIWQDSLAYVVKLLVQIHSSYKYFSLDDDSSLLINDLSVKTLDAVRFNLWKKYTEEKAALGSASAVLDRVPVSLRSLVGAEGLLKLQTAQRVTFVLPPGQPQFVDLCKVFVDKVDVRLYSQGTELQDYGVTLVHHGHSLIFDAQGGAHTYSHVPLRIPYRVEGRRPTVLGETDQEDYVGVSPYGPWTLELDTSTTVSELSDVILHMTGRARARNRAPRA